MEKACDGLELFLGVDRKSTFQKVQRVFIQVLRPNAMLAIREESDLKVFFKRCQSVAQQDRLTDGDVGVLFPMKNEHGTFELFHLKYGRALFYRRLGHPR